MFKFNAIAASIKSASVAAHEASMKAFDNTVMPASVKLDDAIVVAIPYMQAKTASVAQRIAVRAEQIAKDAAAKSKTLKAQSDKNYAAIPVKEVKQVVVASVVTGVVVEQSFTDEQYAAYGM